MQALKFLCHITLMYLHLYVYQWMANVGMFVKSTLFILLDACLPPGGSLPGPFGAWVALRSWRVGGPAGHGMGTWIEHAGFQEIDWLKSNPYYNRMQEMWNVSLFCQSVYIWDIVVLNLICMNIYIYIVCSFIVVCLCLSIYIYMTHDLGLIQFLCSWALSNTPWRNDIHVMWYELMQHVHFHHTSYLHADIWWYRYV